MSRQPSQPDQPAQSSKQLTVIVSPATHNLVEVVARDQGKSRSQVLNSAIERGMFLIVEEILTAKEYLETVES